MDNKFFTFIKPYLSFIDNGSFYRKPFSWLYALVAVLNLVLPFGILYQAMANPIFPVFSLPAKFIIVFLLIWIVIAIVSWISFQLWWDRKSKITKITVEGDEFVATPVFSHFIQTLGEWLGTWVAIVGGFVALIATIVLGDEAEIINHQLEIPFLQIGLLFVVLMPIYGFLIIVVSRFLAEQFRAVCTIANNTKK